MIIKNYDIYTSGCFKSYNTRLGFPIYIDISTGIFEL